MSERKRGGLDYTPRAFPGSRDPDGPAPDMEAKLAELGLLEGAEPVEVRPRNVRADAGAERKPVTKKRAALEYTPQAFPGSRDPDGPAPGMEERLIKSGWAQASETRDAQPGARPEARPAPPPPARREQHVAPPPASNRSASDSARAPAQTSSREPAGTPPPSRSERTAPPASLPRAQRPKFAATPEPVYFQPSLDVPRSDELAELAPEQSVSVPRLPRVPPELVPRPAPVVSESRDHEPDPGIPATISKPATKREPRAVRGPVRIRPLADKEARARISVRLVSAIDEKLDDLAHLRGLDRNTAVSVAIVQDWVACFGLQARQAGG